MSWPKGVPRSAELKLGNKIFELLRLALGGTNGGGRNKGTVRSTGSKTKASLTLTRQRALHERIKRSESNKLSHPKTSFNSNDDEERRGLKYTLWREAVFARDKHTCQLCKTKGGQLNAHHIKPWNKSIELRFVVSNGITLCEFPCHREMHKQIRLCKEFVNQLKNVTV